MSLQNGWNLVDSQERLQGWHENMNLRIRSLTLLLFFLLPPVLRAQEANDWAVSEPSKGQVLESVERWCEIGGSKVRYTNFPLPGYKPCGNLSVQKTCDATGQRFFGPGPSPHSYLDCSKGQRLFVTSSKEPDQIPEAPPPPDGDVGKELARIDKQRRDLDSLLDSPKSARQSSRGSQANQNSGLPQGLSELMKDLPFDPRELANTMKAIKTRNAELDQLLNDN